VKLGNNFPALRIAALVLFLAYPFVIFFYLNEFGAGALGMLLVAILLFRYFPVWLKRLWLLLPAGLAVMLFAFLAPAQSELALRYYPVVISLILLIIFSFSLLRPPGVIERFAIASGAKDTPQVKRYTRNVTLIWCVFFLFNASVSGGVAYIGNMQLWAIYNGLLSYILIGLLIGGEMIYRRYRISEHDISSGELVTEPRILSKTEDHNCLAYVLSVDENLKWFQGHFPEKPILPGVVQIHWAIALAEPLGIKPEQFQGIPRIKFTAVIAPGTKLTLGLEKTSSGLRFRYESKLGVHSQGAIHFA